MGGAMTLAVATLEASIRGNRLADRNDARRLLLDLFQPLIPAFSPGRAQVKLGRDAAHFDRKAAWFEGFARPLWGLAPLHAGGGKFDQWALFREGIASGVDPGHPEYWELTADHNQRSVEMAALGFALALAPDRLWEPQPQRTRDQLAAWLGHIQSVAMADNNWRFFPVMAGLGLQRVGVAIDEAAREQQLRRLDEFYRRDGWYMDGPGGFIDHYNGFALQFYGLIYARHAEASDPARAALYRDRARQFAQGFRYWFADDGAALAIGRSLTYRFAMAGFWAALAYADVEALPWGQIRGLWARHLRWWLDKPILDAAGRLSVGYGWPSYLMSEEYNSPGSPYWAFKAFLPLALPADHPFWTAAEEDVPPLERPLMIPGASMLLQRDQGDVVALPAAPVRLDMRSSVDKYGKFAYSSRFGLCVEAERWIGHGFVGDNILAVSRDGGEFRARRAIESSRLGERWLETRWSPASGVTITTLQAFIRGWELRLHDLASEKALTLVETGHCVPTRIGTRGKLRAELAAAPANAGHGLAILLDDGHRSAIADLGGTRFAGAADAAPNTNILFPHAAAPYLAGSLASGRHLLVTAVRATKDAPDDPWDGLPTADDAIALARDAGWDVRRVEAIARSPAAGALRSARHGAVA
jgi:hypothetical protein